MNAQALAAETRDAAQVRFATEHQVIMHLEGEVEQAREVATGIDARATQAVHEAEGRLGQEALTVENLQARAHQAVASEAAVARHEQAVAGRIREEATSAVASLRAQMSAQAAPVHTNVPVPGAPRGATAVSPTDPMPDAVPARLRSLSPQASEYRDRL